MILTNVSTFISFVLTRTVWKFSNRFWWNT